MPALDEEEKKRIVKEALKEWMDEKYAEFGKGVVSALIIAAFGAFIYLILYVEVIKK